MQRYRSFEIELTRNVTATRNVSRHSIATRSTVHLDLSRTCAWDTPLIRMKPVFKMISNLEKYTFTF